VRRKKGNAGLHQADVARLAIDPEEQPVRGRQKEADRNIDETCDSNNQ
jgi:hypothetical protein